MEERRRISKTLDVEIDYFVTKAQNAYLQAKNSLDFELIDELEEQLKKIRDLQSDLLVMEDGVFTVSTENYLSVIKYQDAYRKKHQKAL